MKNWSEDTDGVVVSTEPQEVITFPLILQRLQPRLFLQRSRPAAESHQTPALITLTFPALCPHHHHHHHHHRTPYHHHYRFRQHTVSLSLSYAGFCSYTYVTVILLLFFLIILMDHNKYTVRKLPVQDPDSTLQMYGEECRVCVRLAR